MSIGKDENFKMLLSRCVVSFPTVKRRSTLEQHEMATKKLINYIDKYVVQQKLPKYKLSEELRNLMKESNNDQ